MDEFENKSVTPDNDDNWQTVATVSAKPSVRNIDYEFDDGDDYDIIKENAEAKEIKIPRPKRVKKKKSGLQLIVAAQLVVFAAVILIFLGLKTFGGDIYSAVSGWYTSALGDSLIITESWKFFL